MKRSNLLILCLALALPTLVQAAVNIGIEGSPHDFSGTNNLSWNSRRGVCSPCHAAHNTDPNQIVPLWAHATSSQAFQMYTSPTMDAVTGTTPDGTSLACLSCHDGITAINATIGNPNPTPYVTVHDTSVIGTDLHTTHPISFVYDSALAAEDRGLENPLTYKIGDTKTLLTVNNAPVPPSWSGTSLTGKSINDALLVNGKMQCSSCHDAHKMVGSSPSSGIMVKISGSDVNGRGSLLCRTCHIK